SERGQAGASYAKPERLASWDCEVASRRPAVAGGHGGPSGPWAYGERPASAEYLFGAAHDVQIARESDGEPSAPELVAEGIIGNGWSACEWNSSAVSRSGR